MVTTEEIPRKSGNRTADAVGKRLRFGEDMKDSRKRAISGEKVVRTDAWKDERSGRLKRARVLLRMSYRSHRLCVAFLSGAR